jgi:hypothetical protein
MLSLKLRLFDLGAFAKAMGPREQEPRSYPHMSYLPREA